MILTVPLGDTAGSKKTMKTINGVISAYNFGHSYFGSAIE